MKFRKIDTDDALLPAPVRQTNRYAERKQTPPWPVRADVALIALTCAARDQLAYTRACELACRVFDREPIMAAGRRWDAVTWARERIAAVEGRTVTQFMSGSEPDVDALARVLYTGRRADRPLTWGEWLLLDKYGRKDPTDPRERKRPMPRGNVLCAMDRPADDVVATAIPLASAGDGPVPGNPVVTERLLRDLLATEAEPSRTASAWAALLAHLWG